MKKVFVEVNSLDKRCYDEFGLNEYILMEHAALNIYNHIKKLKKRDILIVSGPGNNGADGITLARLLYKDCDVKLYLPYGAKSFMAKYQLDVLKKIGFDNFIDDIQDCEIVVDCLFGSGLNKVLDEKSCKIIESLNKIDAYKIACDIPSGLDVDGNLSPVCFKADITITMGAVKLALLSDIAKDFVGKIKVANLGIDNSIYEQKNDYFLLEKKDLKLPIRKKLNSNKGDFGHLNIIVGQKSGAAILSAISAFNFGSGLVSLITKRYLDIEPFLMQSNKLSSNVSAIAVGMGLGSEFDRDLLNNNIPKVIDADLFKTNFILELLKQQNLILTPHPKEFVSLLNIVNIANISVDELQKNRFKYVRDFCQKYKNIVLVLKGANIIIAQNEKSFICNYATNNLSKGGSGDVLAGVIASLLAQKYSLLDSAINGVLAFSLASRKYSKNNYSLTPLDLINELKIL